MAQSVSRKLDFPRKLLLSAAAMVAITVPVFFGYEIGIGPTMKWSRLYDRAAPSALAPQEVRLVCPVHIPGLARERNQSAD
jgi:hypothetical protein